MKQYRDILKRSLGIALIIFTLFTFVACDDANNEDPKETVQPTTTAKPSNAVMTIHGYEISKSEYTIMLYDAAVELKMEAEPEEEMTDEEYEEWFFNFYNIAIDGKMPFDIVRENVLVDLKEYAYYMQEVRKAGMTMSDADKNDIETNVLISVGEEYDPEHPDDYFIYTYGVTKDQYVEYLVNLELIELYIDSLTEKETVSKEDVNAYLDAYASHYMVWEIQNIYLSASTDDEFETKLTLGESLAQKIRDGKSMTNLKNQYSEDGSEGDGTFIVSREELDYPISILDWVYAAKKNDVGVVKAEDGVYVLKCLSMEVEEDATAEIQYVLAVEQIKARVDEICQGEAYTPQLNATVYNSFKKLPGDLMLEDTAVG